MGLSSFPSLVKATMPAYNDSDTDRQPFKRSGKKCIQTDMAPSALQNPSSCWCSHKRKRKDYENISLTNNVRCVVDAAESQKL